MSTTKDYPYDSGKGEIIESFTLSEGARITRKTSLPEIVILRKGAAVLSGLHGPDIILTGQKIFIVPAGHTLCLHADKPCRLYFFRCTDEVALYPMVEHEPFDRNASRKGELATLRVKKCIRLYLCGLMPILMSKEKDTTKLTGKVCELVHLLGSYYSPGELTPALLPVIDRDSILRGRIYSIMRNDIKVNELAVELGMCYGKLIDTFYRVFGVPPKEFINNYKKQNLIRDLYYGDKPLKVLAGDYGFGSFSSFTRFCRSVLGSKPADIRGKERTGGRG